MAAGRVLETEVVRGSGDKLLDRRAQAIVVAASPYGTFSMPMLQQAVGYWTAADGKLGPGADHTEIFRYAEMLAEEGT